MIRKGLPVPFALEPRLQVLKRARKTHRRDWSPGGRLKSIGARYSADKRRKIRTHSLNVDWRDARRQRSELKDLPHILPHRSPLLVDWDWLFDDGVSSNA